MFKRKLLQCSFCGKDESEVAKLVAGPRVYICDACVAEALRIMQASAADPDPVKPAPAPVTGGTLRMATSPL